MSGKALLKAVSDGRPRQVRLLLDSGVQVDDVDDCGQTSLIRAVFIENDRVRQRILRLLLSQDAQVSKSDIVGRNALAWSSLYGHYNDVQMLLHNADVDLDLNSMDINGQTILYHAVSSGSAATVKMIVEALLKYGLSVDVKDNEGFSPLMHAFRLGHDVCASILIQNGKAKCGLGSKHSKNFTAAQLWAKQEISNAKQKKSYQFPPIMSPSIKNKIRFRENLASVRSRSKASSVCSDSADDTLSSTDFESSASSDEDCFNDVLSSTPVKHCLNFVPYCRIPSSILALSPTTSTEVVVSSDEDSSSLGTPVNKTPRSPCDMYALYSLKQDQMSSSYRVQARPVLEPIGRGSTMTSMWSETSDTSEKNIKPEKISEASKWTKLKNKDSLLTKNKVAKLDTVDSKPSSPNIKVLHGRKSKASEQSQDLPQKTPLPNVMDKNKRVQNDCSHRNYSLI